MSNRLSSRIAGFAIGAASAVLIFIIPPTTRAQQAAAGAPAPPQSAGSARPVEWSKLVGLSSLHDIDGQLQGDFSAEPFEVERAEKPGERVTIKTCLDYLALTSNGAEVYAGNASDTQIVHSTGVRCQVLQLLKNARPPRKTFVADFRFTKELANLLSPGLSLGGTAAEVETAEKQGRSLKQFDPSIKTTVMDQNHVSLEAETWGADFYYYARGDFDGHGLEQILVERDGHFTGGRERDDALLILTRTTNSGALKVVRKIQ